VELKVYMSDIDSLNTKNALILMVYYEASNVLFF